VSTPVDTPLDAALPNDREADTGLTDTASVGTARGRDRNRPSRRRVLVDLLVIVACIAIVGIVVRSTILQTFAIPTESMEATLMVGDRVAVDKLSYRFRDPHRQEIVVFRTPAGTRSNYKRLVKRVIGVPGDVVTTVNGAVLVNGQPLGERYLESGTRTDDLTKVVVPPGSYFVMGDNRPASYDGRYFGLIRRDAIVGRAVLRVWPITRIAAV
jgi:signal peptidase I